MPVPPARPGRANAPVAHTTAVEAIGAGGPTRTLHSTPVRVLAPTPRRILSPSPTRELRATPSRSYRLFEWSGDEAGRVTMREGLLRVLGITRNVPVVADR
jgi:hypothetical protein